MICLNDKIAKAGSIFEKAVFSKLFCYLLPFLGLGSYMLTQDVYPATNYYLIQYLYTYDHGYVSRGLVGEIISWFADTVTDELTQTLIVAFSWVLIVAVSLCMGKALSLVRNDKEKFCRVLFVLATAAVLPFSFRLYSTSIRLDKLVWAVTLFAVFLSDRKFGIWLVPALCVLATMINPIFVFTSMILIAIILLQEYYSSGYSKKNLVICILSYGLIIVFALLVPISATKLGFETPAEMFDYYFARYAGEVSEETYNLFMNEWLLEFFIPVTDFPKTAYSFYVEGGTAETSALIFLLVEGIPSLLALGILWHKAMKAEENKFQKFIFFLCGISPIITVPMILISWDLSKILGSNILAQLGLIAYYLVKDNAAVKASVNSIVEFSKKHVFVSACAIMYALLIIVN